MSKNPDLCERPYCRARWTYQVDGFYRHSSWNLHVCDVHVREYSDGDDRSQYTDSVGRIINITPRERIEQMLTEFARRGH
jgi:hypothetical protein